MTNLLSLGKHWAMEPDAFNRLTVLSTSEDKPLAGTRTVTVRNGAAIIPVHGVITARMNLLTFLMGGTALDVLAKDFQKALDDPEIEAIVFDFDSPGGIAIGPAEMAEVIFNARGRKPMVSYVGRNCCSAAYWIASATERIVAHPSSLIGSIGVVSAFSVQESPDSDGCRTIEVVSSNAKAKRPDPRTPEGMTEIRRELDAIEAEFINDIAKYRNTSGDIVRRDFGNGGVFTGHEATARRMADEIGSFDDVLNKFSKPKGENMENDTRNGSAGSDITAEFIRQAHPDIAEALAKEGFEKGKAEGMAAERSRIIAIESMAMAGHEELVAKAKADGSVTAETLAVEMVRIEKNRGLSHLSNLQKAEAELPKVPPSFGNSEEVSDEPPLEEAAKAEWSKSAVLRREFADDFEDYLAFRQAQEKGLVRILSKRKGEE